MENIDFKRYKRFFAFGCSFTDYYWPTWANIIAKEIPDHFIYARCGAGNFFIYQSLIEAIIRHNIDKDDLVMIMFSNITREDRFVKDRGWITPGNLYYQTEYDNKFLKKYLCHHGYLIRDLNLIQGVNYILDNIGCDYELMSMVPFESEQSDGKKIEGVNYILDFYKNILSKIKPSVLEVIFDNDWDSRPNRPEYKVSWQKEKYRDNHPVPQEYLEYLMRIYPEIVFSTSTLDFVNQSTEYVFSDQFSMTSTYCYNKNLPARLGE